MVIKENNQKQESGAFHVIKITCVSIQNAMRKIRFISIILTFCLLVAILSGCKSKETFFDICKEIKEMKNFDYSANLNCELEKDSNVNLKMSLSGGVRETDFIIKPQLTLKSEDQNFDIQAFDIRFVNGDLFINIKDLLDSLSTISPETNSEMEEIQQVFDKDYIKIDGDEFASLMEYADIGVPRLGTSTSDLSGLVPDDVSEEAINKSIHDFLGFVIDTFEVANEEYEFVEKNNDSYVLTINDQNVENVLHSVGKALEKQSESYASLLVEDIKALQLEDSLGDVSEEEFKDSLKELCDTLKEFKYEEDVKFEIKFSLSANKNGSNKEYVASVSLNASGSDVQKLKLEMSFTLKENNSAIEKPTNYSTMTEIIAKMRNY